MTQSAKFIWQKTSLSNLHWDSAALMQPLGGCRFQQGSLLAQMRDLGLEIRQQARAEVLVEEVLKTSAIEGERLDPNAVRSSVARNLGLPTAGLPDVRNQLADGVVEILLDATQGFDKELTVERMFGWHAALFPTGYSGLHKILVAKWRDDREGPMRIVSGPVGRERVHYEAPPADCVAAEMSHFIAWWATTQPETDGLLRAAVAHLRFVVIHPFEDGNGRLARTLTDMALAQDESLATRYYSLSSQIMSDRVSYYAVLEKTNRGDGDITEWILWFLNCMSKALHRSNDLLANVMRKSRFWQHNAQLELNDRQCKVINRLLEAGLDGFEGGMTNRKYASMVHVSRATAQRELAYLVEKKVLCANSGGGRSASYRMFWENFE